MSTKEDIDRKYNQHYRDIMDLLRKKKDNEADALAFDILDNVAISRYHQIKVHLIFSYYREGQEEITPAFSKAEALWQLTRKENPVGEDKAVDRYMAQLRELLDWLEDKSLNGLADGSLDTFEEEIMWTEDDLMRREEVDDKVIQELEWEDISNDLKAWDNTDATEEWHMIETNESKQDEETEFEIVEEQSGSKRKKVCGTQCKTCDFMF